LRSLGGLPESAAQRYGFVRSSNWVTSRVDLRPGREALWKALDRDAIRWAIGKAARQGVKFTHDATWEGIHTFYKLFTRTRQEMGIPVFPWKFFQAMWSKVIEPGRGSLFLVHHDREPIHAMICFHSGDSFIPAYAAPQNMWRKLHPNEFMFWHTIEWAAERGFRWYDFGADSRLQTGLLFFKSKWGSVQLPMAYEYHLNAGVAAPNFDSSSRTYALARKVWRWLPGPVSAPLGGWVTRQLS
jgi:lipid II:glycine glycyltransferase (peptidoglycan interpeptide bridge formation enzyme)